MRGSESERVSERVRAEESKKVKKLELKKTETLNFLISNTVLMSYLP